MILQILILSLLLTVFFDQFLKKKGWIHQWGVSSSINLIYELTSCSLCTLFWIGIICTGIISTLHYIGFEAIAVPFCLVGAIKLIGYDS